MEIKSVNIDDLSTKNKRDQSLLRWQKPNMGTVWKLSRITGLYIAFSFLSGIISNIFMGRLPDATKGIVLLLLPIALVIWCEKRRTKKNNLKHRSTEEDSSTIIQSDVAVKLPHPTQKTEDIKISRTEELRQKLFGSDIRVFLPANPTTPQIRDLKIAVKDTSSSVIAPSEHPYKDSEVLKVQNGTVSSSSRIKELQEKLFGEDCKVYSAPAAQNYISEPLPHHKTFCPTDVQGWVPKGQIVNISGRHIDGMIYIATAPNIPCFEYGEKCRAYVDPSLPVAVSGSDNSGSQMPYWPSYSSIPSICRATFLDWLAGGRIDSTANPGYMFLFFYGLERRLLIEHPSEYEKQEIITEVERLMALFSHSHSVQSYLGKFLAIASIQRMGEKLVDEPWLKQSILQNRSWDLPLLLKFALGVIITQEKPFDAEWLYLWLMCHPERRLRTPAERCSEEFKALFKLKFDALYPGGLKVRTPRKKLIINYRAASNEFEYTVKLTSGGCENYTVPDVTALRSPVEKAQKIADETMEELDKFSRYLGRKADGRGSIEAQALLPAKLWDLFPSAQLADLKEWADGLVKNGGLITALEVVNRLEGCAPQKISKKQLIGAADTLARVGFGMAPDPRFSLRGPNPEEPVIIFDLGERVEKLEVVSSTYKTTLYELAVASFVAHSDSKIVEAERRMLREKVEVTQDLTSIERKLLHANLEWHLIVPPDMAWLRSRLKEVDAEHQLALRAAVVLIARADSVLRSEEVACIEKIYKALGIDADLVYADLHASDVADGPVRVRAAQLDSPGEEIAGQRKSPSTALDAARIASIRNDTERASAVLGEIFAADDDTTDDEPQAPKLSLTLSGLDPKHAALVDLLVQRQHWTQEEFDNTAVKHGLMPSGALEMINEWAFEKFEEALLEEYDGYDVSQSIAEAWQAEMWKGDI